MSEEIVDALVLQARFDDAGLAQSARKVLDQVQNVSWAVQQATQGAPFGAWRWPLSYRRAD